MKSGNCSMGSRVSTVPRGGVRRRFGLAVLLAFAAGCPRRSAPATPPVDADSAVRLHVEHAIGVPVVDIRDEPEAGTTRVQIGGASVRLPSREPDPPASE